MVDSEFKNASIGTLVQCGSDIGIIKYIGPVNELKNKTEIWYGIEWKDPTRGKHDGFFKGTRYFETKSSTGGSFVHPTKVDFGIDLQQALTLKYLQQEEIENGNDQSVLYNNFNFDDKEIMISCVVLAYSRISSCQQIDLFKNTFPHIKELDIEGNLLSSWSQIFLLLNSLKGLKLLNVSNNLLGLPDKTSKFSFDENNVYENIEHLIMNRMNYNWADVEQILKHFPNLQQLKVCFNLIGGIDKVNSNLLKKVKILDLEANRLNDWTDLKKFGELKELETLYANNVCLTKICFSEVDHPLMTGFFPKLKIFSINENKIDQWTSINELRKLESLEEFSMKFNTLNGTDNLENIRQFVIAKLSRLKIFNRTPISPGERKGSEIDYLKKFGQEWIDITSTLNEHKESRRKEFISMHPSYMSLIDKYGAAEKSEVTHKDESLKSSLIWVNIKDEFSGDVKRKKIPVTSDLQRIKLVFLKLFGYKNSESESISLWYSSVKFPGERFALDNELRSLDFYSIENEDTIVLTRNR